MARGVFRQVVGTAGSGHHHLVIAVEGGILLDPEGIVPLWAAVALGADRAFPLRGEVLGADDSLAPATSGYVFGAGTMAGFAADIQFLLLARHRMQLAIGVSHAFGHQFAGGIFGDAEAVEVAGRALDID